MKTKMLTEEQKAKKREHYWANKKVYQLRMKKNYEKTKEERSAVAKEKYKKNKKLFKIKNELYRKNNKESISIAKKEWYKANRSEILEKRKRVERYKLKHDSYYKFCHGLRNRIRIAIKNKYKAGSAVRDLGCSGEEAFEYIESKFTKGMSWDNHGEWHIDHVIPLSKFNLEDREQFVLAVHHTNLQPLWAIDNLRKNDKI